MNLNHWTNPWNHQIVMQSEAINILTIQFAIEISRQEIPLFRGAINYSLENQSVLFHNHDGDGLRYAYPLIQYKQIKDKSWKIDRPISKSLAIRIKYARYWDMALDSADQRYRWWNAFFNCRWLYDDKVCPTITGQDKTLVWWENRFLNNSELILAGSFPQDYDFGDIQPTYLIWMSVPPLMMYKLSNEIKKQRLDLIYKK